MREEDQLKKASRLELSLMLSRPRRVLPNALNTPTCVHIKKVEPVQNVSAEEFLSNFIQVSENIVAGDELEQRTGLLNLSSNNAVLLQLRRIQRNLRGLPPLADALPFGVAPKRTIESEETTQNKKIKFDDEKSDPVNKKIKFDDSDDAAPVPSYVDGSDSENEAETTVDNDDDEEKPCNAEEGAEDDKKANKKEKKEKKLKEKLAKKEKKKEKKSKKD